MYGVNRRALLSTLEFCDLASGALIPDIMHDVLEGALPLEVKLMLKVMYIPLHIINMHNIILCNRCLWLTERLLPLILLMKILRS